MVKTTCLAYQHKRKKEKRGDQRFEVIKSEQNWTKEAPKNGTQIDLEGIDSSKFDISQTQK